MDIQFRGHTKSGDPQTHISYAVFQDDKKHSIFVGYTKIYYEKMGVHPNDTITFIGALDPDSKNFITQSQLQNYSFSHFCYTDKKTKFITESIYGKTRGIQYEYDIRAQKPMTVSKETVEHYHKALEHYEKANKNIHFSFDETSFATNMRICVDQFTKSLILYYDTEKKYEKYISIQKIQSDTLYNRISFLNSCSYITHSQSSLFHDIRINCNNASHGENVNISETMAKTWLKRISTTLQLYENDMVVTQEEKKNNSILLLTGIIVIIVIIYLVTKVF